MVFAGQRSNRPIETEAGAWDDAHEAKHPGERLNHFLRI
jgi:hypothetical protein